MLKNKPVGVSDPYLDQNQFALSRILRVCIGKKCQVVKHCPRPTPIYKAAAVWYGENLGLEKLQQDEKKIRDTTASSLES